MRSATLIFALAACGGRTDLVPACSDDAKAYCDENGCPALGPGPVTRSISQWCSEVGTFAARVDGLAFCSRPDGPPLLTRVDAVGDTGRLELFYAQPPDLDSEPGGLLAIGTFDERGRETLLGCDVSEYTCITGSAFACP